MAVNLLRGNNNCTTANMGGSCCYSIDGVKYVGSDGCSYRGTYKTDSYVGSASELEQVISSSLSAGLPVAAAVHSTLSGGTQHHWVVVVGRSVDGYRIVDPAAGADGTLSDNISTMALRHYAFGLADYAAPHYGYVSFQAA